MTTLELDLAIDDEFAAVRDEYGEDHPRDLLITITAGHLGLTEGRVLDALRRMAELERATIA